MLVGTADLDQLAQTAATIDAFPVEPLNLADVVCLQLTAEMHNQAREAVLPPSLHPTVPAILGLQVWQVGESPWGAFAMAVARVACRSGVRARGYTTAAFVSTAAATEGLRSMLGFPAVQGDVTIRHSYDGTRASVDWQGARILEVVGLDPEPLGAADVQYTGTLNLAHTPNGLRLVQVEAHHQVNRVERLTARLDTFDASAWGNPLLDPYRVVSCSVALEEVTFAPVRFVCKPDELAFTGTEAVA